MEDRRTSLPILLDQVDIQVESLLATLVDPRYDQDKVRPLIAALSRRQFLWGAMAVGGASILAACAPSASPSPASQTTTAGPLGPVDSVIYLADQVPLGLDNEGPTAALPASQLAVSNLYSGLVDWEVAQNAEGVFAQDFSKLRGLLAENWTQDGLKWTFKLREGVKSAAGNELTADDVIWTFARAKSVTGTLPAGWFLLNLASILDTSPLAADATAEDKAIKDEIVKVDKYTVEIKQMSPNLVFPAVLTVFSWPIFDSTEMKKHATDSDPWAHDWANDTGSAGFAPYAVKSWSKGTEFVMEANPNWTDPELVQPLAKQIVVRQVPSGAVRVTSVESGEGDVTGRLTSRQWSALQSNNKVSVVGDFGVGMAFLSMNFNVKPWDNILFRQAVAFAIPYDDIITGVYAGLAKRSFGVVPESFAGYKRIETYKTDPDKAAELLAQAGYPGGQGLEAFGDALTLSYISENQAQLQPFATLIQSALVNVDIPIQLNPLPSVEWSKRQFVDKDLPFAIDDSDTSLVPDTIYATQVFWLSTDKGGINNMVNYANPTLDDLYIQAKSETDVGKRNDLAGQIQEIVMNDVAWLPVVLTKTLFAYNKALGGYAWGIDDAPRFKYLGKRT